MQIGGVPPVAMVRPVGGEAVLPELERVQVEHEHREEDEAEQKDRNLGKALKVKERQWAAKERQ